MFRTTQNTNERKSQGLFWAVCAVLVVAIAFGGGGSRYGFANLIVQLAALGALAFNREAFIQFWSNAPWALRALVGLTILLPSLFLVPLPPQIWTSLPGRQLVVQAFEFTGGVSWAAASVDPIRTLLALTALITPLAILTIGWNARKDQLISLGWIIVLLGLANFVVGIVQVLSNGETGLFYPENPMPGVLFGTFANRNTTGIFLVACLAFAALLPAPPKLGRAALTARLLICVLLLLAVLLTRSRTAIVLSALPLAALIAHSVGRYFATQGKGRAISSRSKLTFAAVITLGLGVVASVVVLAPGRVGEVVERFQSDRTDARAYIWEDASYAASRYWPVGSGTGTFDDVFQIDESLENVTQRRAGRAHNDYIEVAIETGLAGLLLVAGWLSLLIWLSWRVRTQPDRWIAWSGAITLSAIAFQSVTDYPLRNHSLLAIAAFALVILVRFGAVRRVIKS